MKNFKPYTVLFILLTVSSSITAQKEITSVTRNTLYKKMIHFIPLPLFVGGLEMALEKPTANKESFYIAMGYYTSQTANPLNIKGGGYSDMNGLKVELQYRFYRKSNNYKKNMWISPFFNFKTISSKFETTSSIYLGPPTYGYANTTTTENLAASTVSVGYMLGIRRSMSENIYFDFSFGGALFIPVAGDNHAEVNIPVFNPYVKGIQLKANLAFCIAL